MMSLAHTSLRVADASRSIAFYAALGFEERRRVTAGGDELVILGRPGEQSGHLELIHRAEPDHGVSVGFDHVAVRVEDLDATLAALRRDHLAEPESPPFVVGDGGPRVCFVKDLDGNRIELIERPAAG